MTAGMHLFIAEIRANCRLRQRVEGAMLRQPNGALTWRCSDRKAARRASRPNLPLIAR